MNLPGLLIVCIVGILMLWGIAHAVSALMLIPFSYAFAGTIAVSCLLLGALIAYEYSRDRF